MKSILFKIMLFLGLQANAQEIITGADQLSAVLKEIRGREVALMVNQTSIVRNSHLVDTLLNMGVDIKVIFAPEHGFRGEAEAGEQVKSGTDAKTGLKVESLYGAKKKPTVSDLQGVELIIFDIQDVGARFYTYVSSLHYLMEAAAENKIPILVLDRPNPNGHYVDGPVLDTAHSSFVGMHPVPTVHGLTLGEFAQLINGAGWLKNGLKAYLKVIPVLNYNKSMAYNLPIPPSPNLPNMRSIYLYPTLCFFEGTPLSMGRGTDFPFQIVGFPDATIGNYRFKPEARKGFAMNPPYKDQWCNGITFARTSDEVLRNKAQIDLDLIISCYKDYPQKDKFFTKFFTLLAGGKTLEQQIKAGKSAQEIRDSWQKDIQAYYDLRTPYLLYPLE